MDETPEWSANMLCLLLLFYCSKVTVGRELLFQILSSWSYLLYLILQKKYKRRISWVKTVVVVINVTKRMKSEFQSETLWFFHMFADVQIPIWYTPSKCVKHNLIYVGYTTEKNWTEHLMATAWIGGETDIKEENPIHCAKTCFTNSKRNVTISSKGGSCRDFPLIYTVCSKTTIYVGCTTKIK